MSTGHDDAGNSGPDIMKAAARKLEAEQLEPLSQTHDMERMIADSRALFAKRCSGELKPIKLPFPKLGEALNGGLWPGLYFIIGHTGSGKSQLALQVGLKAAEEGTPVLYIGLELDGPQLLARLAGLVEKTRWSSFYYGKREVNPKTYARLRKLPIRLEMGKSFGWSYDRIGPVVAAMRKKHGKAPVVILDFLQLVQSPETEREDLRERIGKASYAARMAAKDHQAVVLLISSVSRAHYQKMVIGGIHKDGTPKMPAGELVGTGKESGETEFSADAVLVLTSDAKADDLQAITDTLHPRPLTPWYLAPEQALQAAEDVRTDIYALGILLCRLLVGVTPFSHLTGASVLVAHIRTSPPTFATLRPLHGLPDMLEWTVRACLAKSPDDRFADTLEVRRALQLCRVALLRPDLEVGVHLLEGRLEVADDVAPHLLGSHVLVVG